MKVAPIKTAITLTEVEKVDIRIGTIEAVEDIENSNKLVRLVVDFGDHKRRILAGLNRNALIHASWKASRLCSL
jgi:tRNA-binding protein